MEKIINYLDIPSDRKGRILERLPHIGFCPARGGQKTMKREMEQSQRGKLPQYLFVFRENELIGYLFLIGEKAQKRTPFPWWAISNSDELPLKTAIQLLECGIRLSRECACPNLADRLESTLKTQKKGLARRPESACR